MNKLKRLLVYIAALTIGVFVGLMVLNYVVMPLIVGVGESSKIPDIVGLPLKEAKKIVNKRNFKLEIDSKKYSHEVGKDTVVSQIPKAGTNAKEGRTIKTVASLGSKQIVLPDFSGLTERQVELKLRRLNLIKGEVTHENSDSILKGNIIRSDPPKGTEVTESTKVDLVVSLYRKTPTVMVPNFIGKSIAKAESLAQKNNINIKIKYRKIPAVDPKTIYQQSVGSNERINKKDTVKLIANMGEHY